MARNNSEAKAEKKQDKVEDAIVPLVCPHCDNDDIECMSWETTKRVNYPITRDKNLISVDHYHENDSEIEDYDVYCDNCYNTFALPVGIQVDW